MSHQSLRSLCILSALLIVTFGGCRSGKKKEATIDPASPPEAHAENRSFLPPLPSLGGSRPRLLPGGPMSPLELPPGHERTSPTSRSPYGGPSLPLPAPPAEDF